MLYLFLWFSPYLFLNIFAKNLFAGEQQKSSISWSGQISQSTTKYNEHNQSKSESEIFI